MAENETIEKTFVVNSITKRSININGTERDKWEVTEPADENGNNPVHDIWSATLAEKVEANKEIKFKIEQGVNKGGYKFSKVVNVTQPGEDFPQIESKSRFKKNYDALNRKSAVEVTATLIASGAVKDAEWQTLAEEVLAFIEG